MRRATQVILVAAVLATIGAVIVLQATPGSVLAERTVDGASAHREYLVALVALILLGMAALGLDFRDWF